MGHIKFMCQYIRHGVAEKSMQSILIVMMSQLFIIFLLNDIKFLCYHSMIGLGQRIAHIYDMNVGYIFNSSLTIQHNIPPYESIHKTKNSGYSR